VGWGPRGGAGGVMRDAVCCVFESDLGREWVSSE
jgi:hypothetical protein